MLSRMKIGVRLSIGFGAAMLLLLTVVGVTTINMSKMKQTTHALADERMGMIIHLATLRINFERIGMLLVRARTARSEEVQRRDIAAIDELHASNSDARIHIEQLVKDPQSLALMKELGARGNAFGQSVAATLKAIQSHNLTATDDALLALNDPQVQYFHALSQFIAFENKLAATSVDDAERAYRTWMIVQSAVVVLALFGIAAFGLLITRSITRPLHTAVRCAEALANCDLRHGISPDGKDEVTDLLRSLHIAVRGLGGVMEAVQAASASVNTASDELAHGNIHLSRRTEEQAAALQQTSASMEQLTTAVKQNAEGARDATKVSDKAVAIAQRGEEAISAVVRTMAQIGQQARDMGDILTVIDGLAFQTNLLALNAAVEAARAGQQGRGFAVVASEVRALAQRSAESAKEVRLLVEKSIAGAGQGASLVDAAKQTMGEIVQAFSSVTDIVTAIANASQEQGRGIQQINYALAQMDEVTQQNVALVEQASVATQSLGDQSRMLARAVGTFKTP